MARYACSDFHGRIDLAEKVLSTLKSDDILYFLGDAIDRGPNSWNTLNLLLNDERVIFFLGNHEDFLIKTYGYRNNELVTIDEYTYYPNEVKRLWRSQNGGKEMVKKCDELRERSSTELESLILTLNEALIETEVVNDKGQHIILTHAGYTPGARPYNIDKLLWNRGHIYHPWPEEYDNLYIVHGHTPISHIVCYDDIYSSPKEPLFYAEGHKIGIDLYSAYSGWTTMLDLDSFEFISIEGDHKYDIF